MIEKKIKYSWFIIVGVLSFASLLLWREYIILKESTDELYALQEEYRSYLSTLKRLIDDIAQQNEGEESAESGIADEKKKINFDTLDNDCFIVVDRRPSYLKQSLLNYIQEKELNIDLNEIDRIYQSYTGRTVNSLIPPKRRTKATKRRAQPTRRQRRRPIIRDAIFSWPLERDHFWISSFFGKRKRVNGTWGFHRGLDMAALQGTPIKAVASGRVLEAGVEKGYGNTIIILHNEKYKTRYAHLQRIRVKKGQIVKRGQVIGTVGSTGFVRKSGQDASHLHFEIIRNGAHVNPLHYLA